MPTRVVILGAGFAGLELSTRLSEELGDEVRVTLIDANDSFAFGFSKLDLLLGRKRLADVRLAYEPDDGSIRVQERIWAEATSEIRSFSLDLYGLHVREVWVGPRVRSTVSALPPFPNVSYSRLIPLWVAARNMR